ncbi:TonB-dependent receptor SusC [Chryseobacterium aquaeductus]|uniref:TonB-dependent receptor SusC n=1 Tax=Chryseobacterium aquaeductus TaxID=2675056 RepID=A0A9N8MKY4_9FLAO|nr:VWA domain-containing protein [Chryseobacterium aquaeductus]CAA7329558.1 TonB-dependent receptor SusC [Chryseobacterium potabilaquae]CAD7797607.1 TonB-dependent receptor SusC [Chryseobacterium aquaeductus]
MENNHDIDKKFNDASQSLEEPATFPGFEKVWTKVEEKLDKKEEKKRVIPIWFPYGIAASLIIGLGAFYFINKKEVVDISKPQITQNTVAPKVNNVQEIDSIVKSNIEKEIKTKTISKIRKTDFAKNSHPIIPNHYSTIENNIIISDNLPYIEGDLSDTMNVKDIEEVVVLGYSKTATRAKISSSSVSGHLIASNSKSDAINSLRGTVSGLKVNSGFGAPSTSEIVIRGVSSLGTDSAPLFVVDGIVAGKNSKLLTAIDPKKIKEVKILKDFEATSLYGSKAANGVILVTTKGLSESEKQKIKEIGSEKNEELIIKPKEEEKKLPKAGLLTAGEVNDFSKWNYWNDIAVQTLDEYKNIWKLFPERRVSVQLVNQNKKPVIGKQIKLLNEKKEVIWEAVSNNFGNAELWINPMKDEISTSEKFYLSDGLGQIISSNIRDFKNGQNLIILNESCLTKRTLDIAFVVDATGSMGDEISYLQSELLDVLKNVETRLKNTNVRYGSVFYRDHGDDYVTRKFDFSDKAENLIDFIKKQNAGGGGDTPEAVVEAMQVSIDELQWSSENSTKIMFLILDAPPHQSEESIRKLYEKVKLAAKKGITIIPLAASDTDKQTEYLMRTFALLTNGTYTFLTNDSGIGNNHIKPTIDSYEVEKLNDLLLRLILQRATLPECNDGISNDHLNKKMETELDNQTDSKVIIFPNPTKGLIGIKTKKTIDELFVYDLAGKIILRKENLKDNKSIDITAYPQSIYLLRLRFGDQWETFKIIKN